MSMFALAAAPTGMDAVTGAIPTVVTLVSSAFDAITSNPLTALYVAAGLLCLGIGIFSALRGSAHA